jgi:hypothetical protein
MIGTVGLRQIHAYYLQKFTGGKSWCVAAGDTTVVALRTLRPTTVVHFIEKTA